MIRVLHIVGSMNRGGIETFLMNLYRNIDKTKIQFDFAVHTMNECAYDQEIKKLGGRIFYITPRIKNRKKHNLDLNNIFKNNKEIQIVHQHVSSLTYINPLKIAYNNNVKIRIVHSHSSKAESKLHYILHLINRKKIHKYSNTYFSCSHQATKWLYSKSKINVSKVQIIRNGIDVEKFTFNKDKRNAVRNEMGIYKDFVIGHVGRFTDSKNHKFLIDVFEHVEKEIENTKLLLVGHGSLKDELENYVQQKKLEEKVIFSEKTSDVESMLQAMDIFVFPSLFEGLGIALIEAQASGLKCLTSKDKVPPEAKLIESLDFLDLEDGSKHWADEIIKYSSNKNRLFTKDTIIDAGYDIKTVTRDLEQKYLRFSE